jgi:hypothetical protein
MQGFVGMWRFHSNSFFADTIRAGAVTIGALLVLCVSGCGDGKVRRHPVVGTVTVDGQPADGATVVFCPVNGSPEVMRERPFSQTDTNGRYELRTLEPGDGAPAGDYKVTIRWLSGMNPQSPEVDRDRGGGGRAVDRLGNRYWDPEKTPLTAKVESGKNEIPPFELSTKAK